MEATAQAATPQTIPSWKAFLALFQRTAAAGDKPARPAGPKFFETFGDTVRELVFLRNLSIGLSGAVIVLVIAILKLANKPPVVIRVDDLYRPAAIKDLASNVSVTAPEVRNFAQDFTRDLLGWDLYTLEDDIPRALGMMTPEAAGKMAQYLHNLNVKAQVQQGALRTKVVVQDISVEKDSEHAVRIKVRGSRVAQSYQNKDFHREIVFEDTVVLRKVDRSEATPWGLLVEDWSEAIFKTDGQTP